MVLGYAGIRFYIRGDVFWVEGMKVLIPKYNLQSFILEVKFKFIFFLNFSYK
jgi:hypothetical protein